MACFWRGVYFEMIDVSAAVIAVIMIVILAVFLVKQNRKRFRAVLMITSALCWNISQSDLGYSMVRCWYSCISREYFLGRTI